MTTAAKFSVRDCAKAVLEAIERSGDDPARLKSAMQAPVQRLLERDDLLELGVQRQGNNVAFSRYLYFDGQMSILLFQAPKDKPIQPHDHGVWESMFIYRGKVKHTVYARLDDGKRDGFAELKVIDDSILEKGDCAIVAPPSDIHGFVALTDDTYAITIVNGAYKNERLYYQPDQKSVAVRIQKNAH
jgi:predicted metal-dependent enzyme (double-stranded beta helix superfamily)